MNTSSLPMVFVACAVLMVYGCSNGVSDKANDAPRTVATDSTTTDQEHSATEESEEQLAPSTRPTKNAEPETSVSDNEEPVADIELPPFPQPEPNRIALAARPRIYVGLANFVPDMEFAYVAPDDWDEQVVTLCYGGITENVDRTIIDPGTGSLGHQTGTVTSYLIKDITVKPGKNRLNIELPFIPGKPYYEFWLKRKDSRDEIVSNVVTVRFDTDKEPSSDNN